MYLIYLITQASYTVMIIFQNIMDNANTSIFLCVLLQIPSLSSTLKDLSCFPLHVEDLKRLAIIPLGLYMMHPCYV